ncbi:MAG: 2-C-methyl-D-erythritol 2,4-cyclodiphosphate synthase [Nitrospirae bacterium]|nr:MAG: 2-C-methyl-D-erythritol 2,4-cyclodiphosphate synthase [Nitrospirota bacterium]
MRIGQGYDIHPLRVGRRLILGGIEIPFAKGLDGHSDADALTHAVCDAILGALGEGDLGGHFPSSNPQFKDLDSLAMLKDVATLMETKGFQLVNLDCCILAEAPKLSPYLKPMAERLARVLAVESHQINVKVKSGEGLGAIGRGEGIGAQAVCLLQRRPLHQ